MYNKLFTKILDSSIWLEPTPTRIVWLTLIAVMDEHGFAQFASVANVAHRAIVSLEEAEGAISCLENPDPNSSDPDNGGRRIERVPGGWLVLNAEKHRSMVTRALIQEQTRDRVRRFRERLKRNRNGDVTPSEAVSEAKAEAETHAQRPRVTEIPMGSRSEHRSHAVCGRICVPAFLHREFVRLRGDDEAAADTELRKWYRTVDDGLQGKAISEPDGLKFWRGEYKTAFAVPVEDSRAAENAKVGEMIAEMDRKRKRGVAR